MLSPFLTVEEAYLLAKLLRSIDPQAVLALGPVPTAGEDQKFPGGFVISAEKCPNRRGVEEILAHFMHKVATLRTTSCTELGRRASSAACGFPAATSGPWIDEADGASDSSGCRC